MFASQLQEGSSSQIHFMQIKNSACQRIKEKWSEFVDTGSHPHPAFVAAESNLDRRLATPTFMTEWSTNQSLRGEQKELQLLALHLRQMCDELGAVFPGNQVIVELLKLQGVFGFVAFQFYHKPRFHTRPISSNLFGPVQLGTIMRWWDVNLQLLQSAYPGSAAWEVLSATLTSENCIDWAFSLQQLTDFVGRSQMKRKLEAYEKDLNRLKQQLAQSRVNHISAGQSIGQIAPGENKFTIYVDQNFLQQQCQQAIPNIVLNIPSTGQQNSVSLLPQQITSALVQQPQQQPQSRHTSNTAQWKISSKLPQLPPLSTSSVTRQKQLAPIPSPAASSESVPPIIIESPSQRTSVSLSNHRQPTPSMSSLPPLPTLRGSRFSSKRKNMNRVLKKTLVTHILSFLTGPVHQNAVLWLTRRGDGLEDSSAVCTGWYKICFDLWWPSQRMICLNVPIKIFRKATKHVEELLGRLCGGPTKIESSSRTYCRVSRFYIETSLSPEDVTAFVRLCRLLERYHPGLTGLSVNILPSQCSATNCFFRQQTLFKEAPHFNNLDCFTVTQPCNLDDVAEYTRKHRQTLKCLSIQPCCSHSSQSIAQICQSIPPSLQIFHQFMNLNHLAYHKAMNFIFEPEHIRMLFHQFLAQDVKSCRLVVSPRLLLERKSLEDYSSVILEIVERYRTLEDFRLGVISESVHNMKMKGNLDYLHKLLAPKHSNSNLHISSPLKVSFQSLAEANHIITEIYVSRF